MYLKGLMMINKDIVSQASEICDRAESMVKCAHKMLRAGEVDQQQFLEIKRLEMRAQKLRRCLQHEASG